MLEAWGIDASDHRPTKLTEHLCRDAGAMFVMAPSAPASLTLCDRQEHANKMYLFADPFSTPTSFGNGEYAVCDPSFDHRPTSELLKDFAWMRERVLQIRLALLGDGRRLVPATEYLYCARASTHTVIDSAPGPRRQMRTSTGSNTAESCGSVTVGDSQTNTNAALAGRKRVVLFDECRLRGESLVFDDLPEHRE